MIQVYWMVWCLFKSIFCILKQRKENEKMRKWWRRKRNVITNGSIQSLIYVTGERCETFDKTSPNKFQDRKNTSSDSTSDNKHSMLRCWRVSARNFTRGNDRLRPIRIALRSITSSPVNGDNREESAHRYRASLTINSPSCDQCSES